MVVPQEGAVREGGISPSPSKGRRGISRCAGVFDKETKGEDEDAFRRALFEKQRKFLAPTMIPIAFAFWGSQLFLCAVGVLNASAVCGFISCIGALVVAVKPEMLCDRGLGSDSARAREKVALIGMMAMTVLFHAGFASWNAPSNAIKLLGLGQTAFILKLFPVAFHFSNAHFWLLNLTDTFIWTLQALRVSHQLTEGVAVLEFWATVGAIATVVVAQAAGVRTLVALTLGEAGREVAGRKAAEQLKDRFLSYIMHEMRNPLSGASLLAAEFDGILEELQADAADKNRSRDDLHVSVRTTSQRLQHLLGFLTCQLDKMRGVCDDVLQIEKLEKGGFEYSFKPLNVRQWVSTLAGQAKPIFPDSEAVSPKGSNSPPSIKFRCTIDVEGGEEAERMLQELPVGVADFVRLDQVVSNFLSNARKFTKKGSVRLRCCLRLPTKEEAKNEPVVSPFEGDRQDTERRTPLSSREQQWEAAAHLRFSKQCLRSQRRSQNPMPSPGHEGNATTDGAETQSDSKNEQSSCAVMRVEVSDTGPGLSKEDITKLFKPYGQVRAGELQNGGGTGLGLVICKGFVEAHAGGLIGVHSEGRGKGSTFFFEIWMPLLASHHADMDMKIVPEVFEEPKERPTGSQPSPGGEKGDANPTPAVPSFSFNGEAGESISMSCGRVSTQTHEGQHGVSGLEQSSHVRQKSRRRYYTEPPFSCGNRIMEGGNRDFSSSRFVAPPAELVKNLARGESELKGEGGEQIEFEHTHGPSPPAPESLFQITVSGTKTDSNPPASTATVTDFLLVDDDKFCLMAGTAALRRLGFSVVSLEDGDEAVELIVHKRESFRVILMDKNMERKGGIETVEEIVRHFETVKTSQIHQKDEHHEASRGPGFSLCGGAKGMGEMDSGRIPDEGGGNLWQKDVNGQQNEDGQKEGGVRRRFRLVDGLSNSDIGAEEDAQIHSLSRELQMRPLIVGCTGDATGKDDDDFINAGADRVESVQATVMSPAIASAQSTTASSSHYMKLCLELCEAPALFSGVRAKLTRWLKDVEDFYKLEKVLDLDKVLVVKNRMSQNLKEWFDLYEVENRPFQNWETLKAALIELYSDILARQKARKDLKKCRCTGAGVDNYNKRFKPLVAKLKGRLIKEDIVEDYISGLPADVRLETNKTYSVNLVIVMKTASKLEVFLSGGEGQRGGTRDFQRLSAFESGRESARRNSPLGQEERPIPMDLDRPVWDAASQGILLGSVQVPSLDSAETSLECGDSLVEGTLRTCRTMGDSVETSGRGDGGRAEADIREIAEGLELHSRPSKHGHL
uniref:histidine kinase n=1 Tax=Chromera velia CCMP2878 TaxID=1169474 RepID=A0A0G4HAC2_9ALVE|eukprot:Cvel_25655.t1-p1 / transcript=Cvel_25655.t1 / gene=Cvel_25655 / organism=Chromera_velia_CCMP2878 / gene_product=hypothetical protein / transcript_product=hypothetical protein / location=Cvel_scaffold2937:8200-15758(-) / protein_length=1296 / sequence_SO=supercontig / SO=protein_coding / is_pseudo=false